MAVIDGTNGKRFDLYVDNEGKADIYPVDWDGSKKRLEKYVLIGCTKLETDEIYIIGSSHSLRIHV